MSDKPRSSPPWSGLRGRIDRVDDDLLALLAERMELVHEIGNAKQKDAGGTIHDPGREKQVAARWARNAEKHGLTGSFADRVLMELLAHSRRSQEVQRPEARGGYREWAQRVGYQGIPGAFSELALVKLFHRESDAGWRRTGYSGFPALLEALDRGEEDCVMLPVENTISGAIPEATVLLVEHDVVVMDEELWPVEHCLAGLPGTRLSEIERALSHPVALQQCRRRLAALGCSAEACEDTAAAAQRVAGQGDPAVAAVCSEQAANANGLEILSREVADHRRNVTRFLLLARAHDPRVRQHRIPGVRYKTSLVFGLRHEAGALAGCLDLLAGAGINLTRIESRLRPGAPWEYAFFVDFEGHREAASVESALEKLDARARFLRVLGSYPDRMQ